MIPLLTLLVAILCLCVGYLLARDATHRDEIARLSSDIRFLCQAVFSDDRDPDPGVDEDEAPTANVVVLKGRAA